MRLVRIKDYNFGATENSYLQRRKDKHGYIYQVVDEQAHGAVLIAKSVATGAEITVISGHVEDLPLDE